MMNLKLKSFSIILMFFGINSIAQEAQIPEPDFINIPYYYINGTNELKGFSMENVTTKSKISSANYEIPGIASNTRIKSSGDYMLVIKAGDTDPSNSVALYKLEVQKKIRTALLVKASVSGKVDTSGDKIPYRLEKISGKIFKISPNEKLVPGEYLFVAGVNFYTFGID